MEDIVILAASDYFRTLSMLPQHCCTYVVNIKKQSETVQNPKFYNFLSCPKITTHNAGNTIWGILDFKIFPVVGVSFTRIIWE